MAKKPAHNGARSTLIRISKIHILIGIFFAVQIMAYDAAKLITPEIVLRRWGMAAILICSSAAVWYLARLNNSQVVIRNLVWFLIAVDMIIASLAVYSTRGMASRAVFMFVLPILTAAVLQRKGVIYLTSIIAVAVYTLTAIAYFTWNFNEGYKIELYGEIGFYSGLLLATGWIAWALVRHKR